MFQWFIDALKSLMLKKKNNDPEDALRDDSYDESLTGPDVGNSVPVIGPASSTSFFVGEGMMAETDVTGPFEPCGPDLLNVSMWGPDDEPNEEDVVLLATEEQNIKKS